MRKLKSSHEKALNKKKDETGSFFDSLDKSLGNGRFGTREARKAIQPKLRTKR